MILGLEPVESTKYNTTIIPGISISIQPILFRISGPQWEDVCLPKGAGILSSTAEIMAPNAIQEKIRR